MRRRREVGRRSPRRAEGHARRQGYPAGPRLHQVAGDARGHPGHAARQGDPGRRARHRRRQGGHRRGQGQDAHRRDVQAPASGREHGEGCDRHGVRPSHEWRDREARHEGSTMEEEEEEEELVRIVEGDKADGEDEDDG
eukprot:1850504-Pyramimonas_sp.AAC.1